MSNLSEAIKEAYASAPTGVVILHTIELYHENFVDDRGSPVAIRLVQDTTDLNATLESTAPRNSNEEVLFMAYPFEITLPAVSDGSNPEVTITIDNISSEIITNIERAVESTKVVELIYRVYLSTDTSYPQHDPPLKLVLADISCNINSISAVARFPNLSNMKFPSNTYNLKDYPALGGG